MGTPKAVMLEQLARLGKEVMPHFTAASGEAAPALVGDRAVDLDLGRALGEAFLLAPLAIGGEVRRLPVEIEGGVVLVLLVEDEERRDPWWSGAGGR